jgi:hypothetical protein
MGPFVSSFVCTFGRNATLVVDRGCLEDAGGSTGMKVGKGGENVRALTSVPVSEEWVIEREWKSSKAMIQ